MTQTPCSILRTDLNDIWKVHVDGAPRFATRTTKCRKTGKSTALFRTSVRTIWQNLEFSAWRRVVPMLVTPVSGRQGSCVISSTHAWWPDWSDAR
jgi:hypothetical protein